MVGRSAGPGQSFADFVAVSLARSLYAAPDVTGTLVAILCFLAALTALGAWYARGRWLR